MANFLKRVRTTPVPIDLFQAAAKAIADLPEEDRKTLDGRALAVIHVLGLQGNGELLAGIGFRLEALARRHEELEYRAWSMKSGSPGMDYVHGDVVEAAASEPLVADDDCARFEPKSFFKRVLKIAQTHGEG
jgi:hypothetical protein